MFTSNMSAPLMLCGVPNVAGEARLNILSEQEP